MKGRGGRGRQGKLLRSSSLSLSLIPIPSLSGGRGHQGQLGVELPLDGIVIVEKDQPATTASVNDGHVSE
jgi:hypothetical protein